MGLTQVATAVAAICFSLAEAVNGPTGANNDTTPTATDGDITIHYVTVGKVENAFQPNSINARIGDIVSFQFYPANHSVIRSEFGYPCIPSEDLPFDTPPQFFSGFFPVSNNLSDPPTWNLTINTTQPVFYYCGATGSCTDWGMLGVINANADTPIATQIQLAREADYMVLPGQQAPDEAQLASLSALAAPATSTVTETMSMPMTMTGSAPSSSMSSVMANLRDKANHQGLSSGVVAGIAVGVAAAAFIIIGVLFLLYRNRKLQRKLERERANAQAAGSSGQSMVGPTTYYQEPYPRNSHSGYPPYPTKPFDRTAVTQSWHGDETGGRMSPPPAPFSFNGEQYVAVPAREYNRSRASEVPGDAPRVASFENHRLPDPVDGKLEAYA